MSSISDKCNSDSSFCSGLEYINLRIVEHPRFIQRWLNTVYCNGFDSPEKIDEELEVVAKEILKQIIKKSSDRYLISLPMKGHVKVTCQWCLCWVVFDLLNNLDMLHFVCGKH